jgi:hypothetical protein
VSVLTTLFGEKGSAPNAHRLRHCPGGNRVVCLRGRDRLSGMWNDGLSRSDSRV